MPYYGLRTHNENGRIIIDTSLSVPRFRWAKEVSKNDSGSTTVSGIKGRRPFGNAMSLSTGWTPHIVEISGNTVTWTPATSTGARTDSLIYVVLFG